AKDSNALARWYCEVLGMKILFDNGKTPATYLVGGDMYGVLEIMPDNGAAPVAHAPLDPGLRHIALRVRDFDAVYQALQALAAEEKVLGLMPPGPAAGGGQIAFFHDPEGNLLQIVSRESELV
ncbi:MAG: VOC family protein, partial [Armatimonadetes bacterium]|nr:VOC family protein [Armatimonadota bacterium]